MANPTPRHVPVAEIDSQAGSQVAAFVAELNAVLGGSIEPHHYQSESQAREALEQQHIFAIVASDADGVVLETSGAAGASVAQLLTDTALKIGETKGIQVNVTDLVPLQRGDPRGLAIFYITLASVIIGFIGAMQLNIHASRLGPFAHILYVAAYSVCGGFAIVATVDWLLGAVRLPVVESWAILSLTMFAVGMVATMFVALFGRWAIVPTWGLMVLLGNPSSGGAVSWPLLPSLLGTIGRWLPPGAAVNALHTAVYFGRNQEPFPFLVLAAWALVAGAVYLLRRRSVGMGRASQAEAIPVGHL